MEAAYLQAEYSQPGTVLKVSVAEIIVDNQSPISASPCILSVLGMNKHQLGCENLAHGYTV